MYEHNVIKQWYQQPKIEILVGVILTILLSIPTILPLTRDEYFNIHDNTQIVRVKQMSEALSSGQFPVRWVDGLGYGYGYPIFNFYAPLPYYVGSSIVLLGASPLHATKLMFGIGLVFSAVTMYLLGRTLWGVGGGLISSMLYLYAPYHAIDVYIRGAVGEYWAMAFLPLVFLGGHGLIFNKNHKILHILIAGLGYAGVILSHNITAMLTTGFMALIAVAIIGRAIVQKDYERIGRLTKYFGMVFAIGLGISAFYWLPALVEMKYTEIDKIVGGKSAIEAHFLYIDQLWDSPWGYAGSAFGREDGMSFKIGKMHIVLGVFGLLFTLIKFWKKKENRGEYETKMLLITGMVSAVLAVSVFMTTEYSRIMWDMLPVLEFVQFPWRFIVFIVLTISILGGGVSLIKFLFKADRGITAPASALTVIVIVILFNTKYFVPQTYFSMTERMYRDTDFITWHTSKISDEYLPKGFPVPQSKHEVIHERFSFSNNVETFEQKILPHEHTVRIEAAAPVEMTIYTAVFPGWIVFIDGTEHEYREKNGFMVVDIPEGTHTIRALFTDTNVRVIANTISLLSFGIIFGIIVYLKMRVTTDIKYK
jgi:uncharacterized membrane protein